MEQSERLREVWRRILPVLREVVTDMKITEDELHLAGRYLNRLGQSGMCPALLDVMFAMTSIAAHEKPGGATRTNLEGPYFVAEVPERKGGIIYENPPAGAPILTLHGKVSDKSTGKPIPGAELITWQTDHKGIYDRTGPTLRGLLRTDAEGRYWLRTLLPDDYAEHDHDPIGELFRAMGQSNHRAAHIHFKLRAPGKETLTTQLFMPTSKCLETDYVVGAVMDELTLRFKEVPGLPGLGAHYEAEFDFRI